MNYLDILLLLPLAYGLIKGFMRGLVKELASLAALIIGIFIAYHYSDDVEAFLAQHIEDAESWLRILSYVVIFLGVALVLHVVSTLLTKMLSFMFLGFVNRILGAVFGFAKILLIMLLLIYLLQPYLSDFRKDNEIWQNSVVYTELENYSSLPGEFLTQIGTEIEAEPAKETTPEEP